MDGQLSKQAVTGVNSDEEAVVDESSDMILIGAMFP